MVVFGSGEGDFPNVSSAKVILFTGVADFFFSVFMSGISTAVEKQILLLGFRRKQN